MTATVDLRLRGSLDHLRLLWQVGETLLESVPFEDDPEGTRYNILLAVQEMVTNILRHAYRNDDSQPIELRMEASTVDFKVHLRDRGNEFNPLSYEPPSTQDVTAPPITESGGYGIMIVKMVMDHVAYERKDDWNILHMRKDVDLPVATASSEQARYEA